VLDTGLIECSDYAIFSPAAGPSEHRALTVRSYLVTHPDGVLLWDAGIDDALAEEPDGRQITEALRFRVPRTLASQLATIGYGPGDVDVLGFSHLHIDHVGNAGRFSGARVVMQKLEHDAAYGPDAERLTYMPETYAAIDRSAIQVVEGEHDVFGDGTVVMHPLPGHTPGHQGLRVALPHSGPILLAADIAYSRADYVEGAVRPANVDHDQTRASIETAKAMEADGTIVWLHHDLEAEREIRQAPDCYR
jgi:glyoxylase-like metal-dependent hydrolase (beta-lactamase superfamily II)